MIIHDLAPEQLADIIRVYLKESSPETRSVFIPMARRQLDAYEVKE